MQAINLKQPFLLCSLTVCTDWIQKYGAFLHQYRVPSAIQALTSLLFDPQHVVLHSSKMIRYGPSHRQKVTPPIAPFKRDQQLRCWLAVHLPGMSQQPPVNVKY